MAQLSLSFCRQLARARRDRGLTQSALAQAVGCKQSAISMLESGQPEKLSRETVEKIAALLGVVLDAPAAEPTAHSPQPTASSLVARGYCPGAACPSNVPYTVQGELLFWPRLQPLARGGHCAVCGELLEPRCPGCGAAVSAEGACCPACGGARVANTLPPGADADEWAARRRREIAEWRALLT
jgi:transcriptional regulator with XRE-family HTH domain